MAGPNLELFKFGVYVFFPVAIMLHYGNPDWYNDNILPYREKFWPSDPSKTVPHNQTELTKEIEAQIRLRKLQQRQAAVADGMSTGDASSSASPPSEDRLV